MKRNFLRTLIALSFCLSGLLSRTVTAQEAPAQLPALTQTELEDLVAPIALYPDRLIQVILPASTFPDQIVDASLLIKTSKDAPLIEGMDWDASVKAVANYPGVLRMMSEKPDWTASLGQAFLAQHAGVLDAIQSMRRKAKDVGNLKSTPEQTVKTETAPSGDTFITVEPSNPEVVYVPTYEPTVVYSEPQQNYSLAPLATFGLGLALGSAMDDDDDDVYYGGWGGPGMWYNDDAYDRWHDYREDRWDDVNDYYKNRQDFRQENISNRQDFRQDYYKEHGKLPASGQLSPEQRSQVQARADERRASGASAQNRGQNLSPEQRSQAQAKANERRAGGGAQNRGQNLTPQQRSQAQQRADTARSSGASRPTSASRNNGAFQGYQSGSLSSSYGSRGATSRASAGSYSRPSGGYSGSRGGGGMSRGGGGMSRGGGGMSRGGGGMSRGGGGRGGGGRR